MHVAGQDGLGDLLERDAPHRHPELLTVALVALGVGHLVQVAGQEDPQRLARPTRAGVVVEQQVPLPRHQVGLLVQLARGGEVGGLAVDVEQPGRQFPQPASERVTVLVHQHDPVVFVERHDRHRPVVFDHLTTRGATAGHAHLVGA